MRYLFIIATLLFLISCKQKKTRSYTAEGKIANLNAKKVYMDQILLEAGINKPVDSADVKEDGSFTMIADIQGENIYILRTDANSSPFGSFISDGNKIKVTGDLAKGPETLFYGGSPATDAMKKFFLANNRSWESISRNFYQMDSLVKIKAPDSSLLPLRASVDAEVASIKRQVDTAIQTSQVSILSIMALQSNQRFYSPDEFGAALSKIEAKFPKDVHVEAAKKTYGDQLAAMNRQQPAQSKFTGKIAPEIALNDDKGRPITLSSFKGKYVLVDFWASWCKPCREENPNVVAAYNKYKNKNFTVFGVSLDENEKAWKKAIQTDKLVWAQAWDEKQAAATTYEVRGIPFNVLVDPSGVIVAENLRGPMLEAKLEEVLK